jgi:hypothetical protein
VHGEIGWLERKMNPPIAQPHPAVPWPVQEIVAEHPADITQDLRSARGMKAVAAIVDAKSGNIEAGCVAANFGITLDHTDVEVTTAG